ncbi:MAG: hypothetical protein ABJF23_33100, partial [Bryobacteraceae bacterium]
MPALVYASQDDVAPKFWFLPLAPAKQYSNAGLRKTHEWEIDLYQQRLHPWLAKRAGDLVMVFFSGVWMQFTALGLLLIAIPWARMRNKRWLVLMLATGAASILLEIAFLPHYTAPFTPVLLLLIVACGRAVWYRLSAIRLGAPLLGLVLCVGLLFVVHDYTGALQDSGATQRSRLVQQLRGKSGPHLVFVEYLEGWNFHDEWVYNGADLEHEPVVFVHLRGDAENRKLMAEYGNRQAWLLTLGPESSTVVLKTYPGEYSTVMSAK